jgi:hypothetical protein
LIDRSWIPGLKDADAGLLNEDDGHQRDEDRCVEKLAETL